MTIKRAVKVISVGTVTLEDWKVAPLSGKQSYLKKQEASIPIHLQTGAITNESAKDKFEAIKVLRESIQEKI